MENGIQKRLFIAIELPQAQGCLLQALQEQVRGVGWMPTGQLHLTLRFLGDTSAEEAERIDTLMKSVRVDAFTLALEGLGAFPRHGRPGTLWAGVGSGHPRLFQLRQQIDDRLLTAGSRIDLRTFVPHVTLARCGRASPGWIKDFLHRHQSFTAPLFEVASFALLTSDLTPEGAVHEVERRYPLSRPFI